MGKTSHHIQEEHLNLYPSLVDVAILIYCSTFQYLFESRIFIDRVKMFRILFLALAVGAFAVPSKEDIQNACYAQGGPTRSVRRLC